MWRDLSDADRRDFWEIAVAWVIGAICLGCSLVIINAVTSIEDTSYEPPCRTVGHLEVPCE